MLNEVAPWRLVPIILINVPTGPLIGKNDDIVGFGVFATTELKHHAAPKLLLSLTPPTNAVVPSEDIAIEDP